MKVRSVLFVFLTIKMCFLYIVIYDSIVSIYHNDHPLILNTNDIQVFDVLFCIITIMLASFSIVLLGVDIIGHNRFRKPYVICSFSATFCICLPFYLSAFYLYKKSELGLAMNSNIIEQYQLISSLKNVTKVHIDEFDPEVLANYEESLGYIHKTQLRYCCCGLNSTVFTNTSTGNDSITQLPQASTNIFSSNNLSSIHTSNYTFHSNSTSNHTSNYTESYRTNYTILPKMACPTIKEFKRSWCPQTVFSTCASALKRVHVVRIWLFSSIGLLCTVLYLVILPLLYSIFEFERRAARSLFIRTWRSNVDSYVNNHRQRILKRFGYVEGINKPLIKRPDPVPPQNKPKSPVLKKSSTPVNKTNSVNKVAITPSPKSKSKSKSRIVN